MTSPLRSLPCAVILLLGFAAPAGAQTFTVTTVFDSAGACTPAGCSLRAAVGAANAGSGGDVIDVPPGEYLLPAGQLAISKSVRIRGTAGRADTRLRPAFGTRALNIATGTTVVVEHLTLTGARLMGIGSLQGAAILSAGDLTLSDVALSDNVITKTDAGGIPQGGAVSATGPTTILDSSLTRNVVRGGSIPQGGAVATTGPLTVRRSVLRDNAAETITGGGIPEGGAINAINASPTGPVIIDASQLIGNSVSAAGVGGIPQGGALNVYGMATAISDSVFAGNIASGSVIPQAAAIWAFQANVEVTGTTIEGNLVLADGAGSIADAPFVFGNGALKLTNTTVTGNRAVGPSAAGSALSAFGQPSTPATVTLTNVTLAGNTSTGSGASGAFVVGSDTSATVRNTIISGNLANGAAKGCGSPNLPTSGGHNLSDDPSCAFAGPGDRTGDPGLAALADNGGPTPTRALIAGSSAIDAGDPALCPAIDQRGVTRVATCDIGAFEFVPPPPPPVPSPAAPAPVTPKAAVKTLNASRVLVLPSGKRCLSRRTITLRLRLPAGAVAKTVSVRIGTQKPTVFTGRRLKTPIDLRGLRKGRFTVTVTLRTTDGRSASLKRAYRTCTIKQRR